MMYFSLDFNGGYLFTIDRLLQPPLTPSHLHLSAAPIRSNGKVDEYTIFNDGGTLNPELLFFFATVPFTRPSTFFPIALSST